MDKFISFLWSGFGSGVTGLRAVGIAIIVCLFAFIAAFYVIRFIVRLIMHFTNKNVPSEAEA